MKILLASCLAFLGCAATPAPLVHLAPEPTTPAPVSWAIALRADALPRSYSESDAIDDSTARGTPFLLTLEVRSDEGELIENYDLGAFEGSCEVECAESSQSLIGVRCWENIPGVPYVHHEVMAQAGALQVRTVIGECGYSEEATMMLRRIPSGVRLAVVDNPCG